MIITTEDLITQALREIGVLDPTQAPEGEQITDGIECANELLDSWAEEHLFIGGITIATHHLVLAQQTYTIGTGGNFNQTYPATIERWSVIPDRSATDPVEMPKGRPATSDDWQRIQIKTQTGEYPTVLYFDHSDTAGLGNVLVWPIPDSNLPDVKLYSLVPAILTVASGSSYSFQRGYVRALKLNLAIELADRYNKQVTDRLERRAMNAKGIVQRSNIRPKESQNRFAGVFGGAGRRTNNIYTDAE